MYPRQTTSSAMRASLADEKKRKEKEPAENLKTTSAKSKNHKINVSKRENTATHNQIPVSKSKQYHDNLDFYRNTIRSKPPPGNTIEEMLLWKGDYNRLERNHHYIQWLFPITEGNGMNIHAQPLFDHEAQKIRNEAKMRHRVIKAYKMMLDFYGMQLIDEELGIVGRSRKGWEERYEHLNRSDTFQRKECELPCDNLKFYQNNLVSRPFPGYTIETILNSKGQYEFLEKCPCFIQWLFPVPDNTDWNGGFQSLCEHESKAIRQDDKLSSRVLEAYELILDFYGMRLLDTVSGKIARNKHAYKKRYDIFNRYRYNLRIITQVLKSLGELGFERFQVPWIDFLIQEGIDNAMFPSLDGNCIMHWIDAIRDAEEKQAMFRKYQRLASHSAVSVTGDELDLAGMKLF